MLLNSAEGVEFGLELSLGRKSSSIFLPRNFTLSFLARPAKLSAPCRINSSSLAPLLLSIGMSGKLASGASCGLSTGASSSLPIIPMSDISPPSTPAFMRFTSASIAVFAAWICDTNWVVCSDVTELNLCATSGPNAVVIESSKGITSFACIIATFSAISCSSSRIDVAAETTSLFSNTSSIRNAIFSLNVFNVLSPYMDIFRFFLLFVIFFS